MAEQKSSVFVSRPVIISILAALGIAGAVAAPTIVDCASADAGFGMCVRQKLENIGVVPATQPEAADEAEQTELVANLPDATADIEAAPETADAAPQTAPDASPLINARVEPDGSAVLIGSAAPNSEIQFFANGESIGSTTTDDVGDWVFIPDQPLPAGGVALTTNIGELMGASESRPDSLAIVVDPEKTAEPQVIAGSADQIGQTLTDLTGANPLAATPEAVTEPGQADMEVASVEPQAEVTQEAEPSDRAVTTPIVEPEQATETTAAPAEQTEPAEVSKPVAAESETPSDMEVAAIEPATTEPAAADQTPIVAVPDIAPSIDAVEIDGSANFIAGAGTDGTTVKLFVDDVLVGQTVVDGGRWLVEAHDALTSSNQRIRAEFVSPDGETIEAQPEVNFVIAGLEPDQTTDTATSSAADQTGLSLSAESLAPAVLPTEAPSIPAESVVAETNDAATENEPAPVSTNIVLPDDQLAPLALPLVAPVIAVPDAPAKAEMAAGEEPQATEMTEEQPAAEATTIETPAIVEQPASDAASEPQMATESGQDAASEAPTDNEASQTGTTTDETADQAVPASDQQATEEEPVAEPQTETEAVIPEDQLPPAELPSEAPSIPTSEVGTASVEATSQTESQSPAEPAVSDAQIVTIPENPLGAADLVNAPPAIPVSDSAAASAETPVDAGSEVASEEMTPATPDVVIPEDQLPPAQLPTSAPPIPAPTVARDNTAGEIVVPVDQVPLAEMPTEAPAVPGLSQPEGDEVPTLTVVAVGEPGENRFASGKVIIRRGDNLWTISRRVYGFGREYVRIFEANRDKIENPHWIYPGQVFELPSGE